jgi:hypothetical protein
MLNMRRNGVNRQSGIIDLCRNFAANLAKQHGMRRTARTSVSGKIASSRQNHHQPTAADMGFAESRSRHQCQESGFTTSIVRFPGHNLPRFCRD